MEDVHMKFVLTPRESTDSLELVLEEASIAITPPMNFFIENARPFKFDITVNVTMYKLEDPAWIIYPSFKKKGGEPSELCQTADDIQQKLERDCTKVKEWVEMYNKMASNWIIKSIDQVIFDCSQVEIARGGAGKVSLPIEIENSRCVINFEMDGNQCFLYAILIALHHKNLHNPERTKQYEKYVKDFDISKITFPVNSMQIQTFEKSNPNISVFAHAFHNKGPECTYRTNFSGRRDTVHLFCHMNHWLPITNLSAFYKYGRKHFTSATKCLKSFYHHEQYDPHVAKCTGINLVQNEIIPDPPIV